MKIAIDWNLYQGIDGIYGHEIKSLSWHKKYFKSKLWLFAVSFELGVMFNEIKARF